MPIDLTNTSRRALIAGFGAAALVGCATSQTPPPSYTARPRTFRPTGERSYPAIQSLIDRYIAERKVAGIVVGVQKGHAPLQFLSAGKIALDGAPCDADSIYRVYSMTKPVTGVAAIQLVERGRLTLDTPIADLAPEFRNMRVITDPATMATRPATRPILVRHLMTHTAGFSYHIDDDSPLNGPYRQAGVTPVGRFTLIPRPGDTPLTPTLDAFGAALGPLPLLREPGTQWEYSIGLDVLGLIIQRASGTPFDQYLRENLFAPLRMTDTAFYVPQDKLSRFTTNYNVGDDGALTAVPDRDAYSSPAGMPCGGAGLVASTRDYARFAAMLLRGGALEGARVLSRESVALACSNLMPEGVLMQGGAGFGAGMSVTLPAAASATNPAGSVSWGGAANTNFWVDPANDAYVVQMTQNFGGNYPLRQQIREAAYADFAA